MGPIASAPPVGPMTPISSEAYFQLHICLVCRCMSEYAFSKTGSNLSLQNACNENKSADDIEGKDTEDSGMNEQNLNEE